MIETACIAALTAFLAQHLGLAEELVKVAHKIAVCPKCCTMWITLSVLVLKGYDIVTSVALSLFLAYLSFWISIVFMLLQRLYNFIHGKIEEKDRGTDGAD